MTARLTPARAAAAACAAMSMLLVIAAPRAVRADAPVPHCALDRAHALERQGRNEAAGSGAALANSVDHLRAASGEYAVCASQAPSAAARLALWTQAQAALRVAETPELQVGSSHDVDALLAEVRNYDVAIAADPAMSAGVRSSAHHAFDTACRTAMQGDDAERAETCARAFAATVATHAYLALTPGYHADLPAPAAVTANASATATTIAMPDGLRYTDTVIGSGAEAKFGQHVAMQYVGTLSDGTVFDSSRTRSTPFDFTIGTGSVIACWDEGVVGMRVGGHRTLVCPSSIGYGGNRQGTIPPYSTLHFDLELVGILP